MFLFISFIQPSKSAVSQKINKSYNNRTKRLSWQKKLNNSTYQQMQIQYKENKELIENYSKLLEESDTLEEKKKDNKMNIVKDYEEHIIYNNQE